MSKKKKTVTETQVETNGATHEEEGVEEKGKHVGPFATAQEAAPNKPEGKYWRMFEVTSPKGETMFTFARDHNGAVAQLARKLGGYKVKVVGKTPTPEKIGNLLAQMSEEERQALFAKYATAS